MDPSEFSKKLELFFDMSPDLLCVAGYDGFFKRINPAVSKLLEYSEEELFSKPINEFVHPEDQHFTSKVREELKKSNPLLNFENRYLTKSGEVIWLSWTSMSIDSEKLVFAIAKNITQKKKIEEGRNLLLAQLTQSNKDLKQLSYTTSHDLRSPINNFTAIFNLLDFSKIQDAETVELLGYLKSISGNLNKTINDYIDVLCQKESLNAQKENLNLYHSLNEVLDSISSLISNSKTSLTVDFSEFDEILFNKAYLESIFLNLITNSIKYAKPDTLPSISIRTRIFNGVKQLVFSDEGMGFDMNKVKDRIFGLNQKFHNNIDSHGIGLYLVYNHVSNMGGRIEVESKVNEGASFIISFGE
ncbi:hypothetical protein P872_19540 [Rhodonellum psychrophilum GCM71 = DSM 17998]|uniref:histidine kinase n=2 Tax=Rhodonellum TaxID=336827 RepID=U5C0I0_9BACT|nr:MULTISPECIES: PAS domain-containing sensor histidine kinase [Rhodonellum]ERM81692.1 hypothetical protein P872_19540 [Rhodonellum psychrophilum GCM71 = DSM 17998]MDO9554771.1 PAS domain-containing sensor histidine kinase [Rhodonellum sp.]SDY83390.1 PAS domain S-box-containing protein [Rhodonellum ikkaensis]